MTVGWAIGQKKNSDHRTRAGSAGSRITRTGDCEGEASSAIALLLCLSSEPLSSTSSRMQSENSSTADPTTSASRRTYSAHERSYARIGVASRGSHHTRIRTDVGMQMQIGKLRFQTVRKGHVIAVHSSHEATPTQIPCSTHINVVGRVNTHTWRQREERNERGGGGCEAREARS